MDTSRRLVHNPCMASVLAPITLALAIAAGIVLVLSAGRRSVTLSVRARHAGVTAAAVACARARPALPAALRRLWTSGATFCAACLRALPRLRPPWCARCGAPTAWPVRRCAECAGRRIAFATARAAVAYDERVRRLVAAWKEQGLRALVMVAADLAADVPRPEAKAIAWVPANRDRTLRRGHHPAERLARELAERWQIPALELLRLTRTGSRQRGSSLAERRRNVRGAFASTGTPPRQVLLVDDVYTSGATASAAASALRQGGARRVDVVTFARTLRLPQFSGERGVGAEPESP